MENNCSTLNAALLTTKVTSMRRLIGQIRHTTKKPLRNISGKA